MKIIKGDPYIEIPKFLDEWTEKKIDEGILFGYPSYYIVKLEMKYTFEEESTTELTLFEFDAYAEHCYFALNDFWENQEEIILVAIQPITLEEIDPKYIIN